MATNHASADGTKSADWHRADIIAAVRKAGWNLSSLSRHHGYEQPILRFALDRKWPKGERLIAEAIGIPPQSIWPSRYEEKHRTEVTKNCSPRLQKK